MAEDWERRPSCLQIKAGAPQLRLHRQGPGLRRRRLHGRPTGCSTAAARRRSPGLAPQARPPRRTPGTPAATAAAAHAPHGRSAVRRPDGAGQRPREASRCPRPLRTEPEHGLPGTTILLRAHLAVEGHKRLLRAASSARNPALSRSRHFPGQPARDRSAQAQPHVTLPRPPSWTVAAAKPHLKGPRRGILCGALAVLELPL